MHRDFKGIWIPKEIWLNPKLSITAKSLWAEIHSLFSKERGGCYASNEYLADFLDVKTRRLGQLMKQLKDSGLLEQVSFNGRQRILKAIVPPESDVSVQGRLAINCQADMQEIASLQSDAYIYENKVQKKEKENIKEKFGTDGLVLLTQDQYAKLCDQHTKATIDKTIEAVNNYQAMHGKRYKDHAAAIRQFLKREVSTTTLNPEQKKNNDLAMTYEQDMERRESNSKWVQKFIVTNGLSEDRVSYHGGVVWVKINDQWKELMCKEHGFEDQFKTMLKKGGVL